MKSVLVSSLLASSLALSSEEVKAASKAHKQVRQQMKAIKSLHQHPQALTALKELKQAPSTSKSSKSGMSKAARVTKSSRALRGKAGKGKGKGRDDDNEEEDSSPKMFIQYEVGFCAGSAPFGETLSEDFFMSTYGMGLDQCLDSVDADGMAFSSKLSLSMDPFTVTQVDYQYHGCVSNWMMTSSDITADMTMGGTVSTDGTCTSFDEGYGIRLSVTETPPISPSYAALVDLDYNHANECASEEAGQYNFGFYSVEQLGFVSGGSWNAFCMEEDGVYTMFDPSGCGGSPSALVENTYSDDSCTTLVDTATLGEEMCKFDVDLLVEDLQDPEDPTASFTYVSSKCTPNAA